MDGPTTSNKTGPLGDNKVQQMAQINGQPTVKSVIQQPQSTHFQQHHWVAMEFN